MDHKKIAKKCFNECWDYIEKEDKTSDEVAMMLELAHTSRYHWLQVGGPHESQAGAWQVSKVHYLAGNKDTALFYAKECLRICEENQINGFDICFAHEVMANAYKIAGENEMKEKHKDVALSLASKIEKEGDRKYTISQLNLI